MGNQESGTRGPNGEYAETQQSTQETLVEVRERPVYQTLPENDKNTDICTILQQLLQQTQRIEEQSKETKEQIKELAEKTTLQLAQQATQHKQQIQQTSEQIHKQHMELRNEVIVQLNQEKANNQKVLQGFRVDIDNKIKENCDKINTEICANTEQQIRELDEKYNNSFEVIIKQESVNNPRCAYNNAAISELKVEKLTELETKIDSKSDETHLKLQQIQREVQQIRREVRTKLASITNTPGNWGMINELVKDIKYNGTGDFPMEFIKELNKTFREHYQDAGNIKWIARHLEGEAAVWWRLVKDSIDNFVDFTDAFMNKYANEVVKEKARNHSKSISDNRIRSVLSLIHI